MVRVIDSVSRNSVNSVNSCDRNSPALSMCSWPTIRTGSGLPTLEMALSLATKEHIRFNASDFFLS